MRLSIIVVSYNMARELPRTLTSLQREYQRNIEDLDYEVIVVDNGSERPPEPGSVEAHGSEFRCVYLEKPHPSPACALNYGAKLACGDVLCLMVDGATLLSPGILEKIKRCFRAYENPVVAVRYFFLGPGEQNETIGQGYTREEEDGLIASIKWPDDGYRLFEISTPLRFPGQNKASWMDKIIESTCLFMRKESFHSIDGCDERFDIPGGGFMNIDLFQRAAGLAESRLVLLIGEGVFHQYHGGTTTNVTPEQRDAEVENYKIQYKKIRGKDFIPTDAEFYFFGNMPTQASKIHRRKYGV